MEQNSVVRVARTVIPAGDVGDGATRLKEGLGLGFDGYHTMRIEEF